MSTRTAWPSVIALAALACSDPSSTPPIDAGGDGAVLPDTWSWLPLDGSQCGSGARAGVGVNLVPGADEVVLFFQGGGACWDRAGCAPSFEEFGPVCYRNPDVCLFDAAGGTQPTAAHVAETDPFPADGRGNFAAEIGVVGRATLFDRAAADNPLRAASYVYLPYCTGDLHSGDATATYTVRDALVAPTHARTMHFAGASNVSVMLAWLATTHPDLRTVWLVGISGGGYGAQLNVDRVQRAFPAATVHVLADSAPLLDTTHYPAMAQAWQVEVPVGCTDCDQGFPSWLRFLIAQSPARRFGLLSYDRDRVISWFFYAGLGPDQLANPPLDDFRARLLALVDSHYRGHANAHTFVVPGDKHVFLGDYELRRADGTVAAPIVAPNGVDLRAFLRGFLTGTDWRDGTL